MGGPKLKTNERQQGGIFMIFMRAPELRIGSYRFLGCVIVTDTLANETVNLPHPHHRTELLYLQK